MGKIAAAYIESRPGDVFFNLRGILNILQKMKDKEVDFVLLPELCLSGYISSEDEINAVLNDKEKAFEHLKEFSKKNKPAFAFGFPEKIKESIYISHYLIVKGEIVGIHRKTHLGCTEKEIYDEENMLKVFNIDKLTVGMQLCFETHFPELSAIQAKMGANVLAMAFASPKEAENTKLERFKRFLCARAYDNSCYLLACNLAGETSKGANLPGLAMIIDPKGNVIAEEVKSSAGYCLAEFDTNALQHIYQSKMAHFNEFKRYEILKDFYE